MRPPFTYEGIEYDLSHLNTCNEVYTYTDIITNAQKSYKIVIIYSSHCFTSGIDKNSYQDKNLIYKENNLERIFDFFRYDLSKRIPGIIRNILNSHCYITNKGNFFVIEFLDHNNNKQEYEVYFRLRRSNKKECILYVESAYVRDKAFKKEQPKRDNKIGFRTLIIKIMEKKQISFKK